MQVISLFSGIGGLEYGFGLAGIQTVLQVENDRWCRAILERHWPEVERLDDVRKVDALTWHRGRRALDGDGARADAERLGGAPRGEPGAGHPGALGAGRDVGAAPDVICGGFPCQDVSLAGKRAGLSGERSGLWFEFLRIVRDLRPCWVVVENVPGLLSSHRGRDFDLVLRGLADAGFGWAYRVLDARWFGTPQRRRRIFIVGCAGDQSRAAQVLGVCQSCGGHPQAGGEAGQAVAEASGAGADLAGDDEGSGGSLIMGSQRDSGMARPLVSRATGYRMDIESETFVVAYPVRAADGHHGHSSARGHGTDNLVAPTGGVRRMTPLECERLQGFPDGWTDVLVDGKPIADAHRYRMLGNAVDTVVAQWLGHRLVWVAGHA